jgi:hypothetical protein
MATRMQQRRGTAAEWTSADPVLGEGEIGFETDTNKFKIGDDTTVWSELPYFTTLGDIVDGAPDLLNTLNELAAAIGDDPDFVTTITSRELGDLPDVSITEVQDHDVLTYNTAAEGWINLPGVPLSESLDIPLSYLTEVTDYVDTAIENFAIVTVKTDTSWSSDTSIPVAGSLNVETGSGELKFKIGNGTDEFANLVYVPTNEYVDEKILEIFAGPTFTGTVVLPSTTSIGDITSTEIGYLDGVTSLIQTQLDDLGTDKADLESPTFTGTVSGVTSSMVGLGSVDNTSDADKPVSTAQQAALDTKLNLAGGTMTGKITLDGDPTQALHAVTKQYVDSVEAGLITRPQVVAATTENLDGTYDNGTAGVGATLNLGPLEELDIDGVTSWDQFDGILVKDQTNAAENGRYVVLQVGQSGYDIADIDWILRRCSLCDTADEIPGSYIFVLDGTVNAQTGWVQHVDDPATFTVGTDDIDVYQFAGAGSITAGTNISVSGNQVSVIDDPVFFGVIDASASGVEFSDGVQTQAGVPSLTTFSEKTASYTLDTLAHKDNVVEMNVSEAATFTVPTNATLAWPIGGSMDIFATGSGEVTIAAVEGVTLRFTPGLKLRTQWSSATILKKSTDTWFVYGDLKA